MDNIFMSSISILCLVKYIKFYLLIIKVSEYYF